MWPISFSCIYIPLWFYSNLTFCSVTICNSAFTFHYGSILIQYLSNLFYISRIYIPLWFYSNKILSVNVLNAVIIYIPLWFYSNSINAFCQSINTIFTFHYGSILIFTHAFLKFHISTFTFHYGSILIQHVTCPATPVLPFTFHYGSILIVECNVIKRHCSYLHSTMVLF